MSLFEFLNCNYFNVCYYAVFILFGLSEIANTIYTLYTTLHLLYILNKIYLFQIFYPEKFTLREISLELQIIHELARILVRNLGYRAFQYELHQYWYTNYGDR